MLNKVCLTGRIANNVNLKITTRGIKFIVFLLAVNRNFKQYKERQTDFIECIAWEQTAEFISRYAFKNSLIAIDGELQTCKYKDKNGNKRKAILVIVQNITFCNKEQKSNQTDFQSKVAKSNNNYDSTLKKI